MKKKIRHKHMLTNSIYLIFLNLLLIGCNSQDHNYTSIGLDVSRASPVLLSDLVESLSQIKLETNEFSLLKDIRQIEVFQNYILVKDVTPLLYVFNMEGKFIRTIGKIGGGEGEYTQCLSFMLDEENETILLNTNMGILEYDILGNYIKKYPRVNKAFYSDSIFYTIDEVFTNEDNIYFQKTLLSIYDKDWNINDSIEIRKYESTSFLLRHFSINKPIFRNENNIYVYCPNYIKDSSSKKDTLCILNQDSLHPFLCVELKNSENEYINEIFFSGRYILIGYTKLVKDPLSPYLIPHLSQFLYDFKTKEIKHARNGFINDFYNDEHVILSPLFKKGMFYCIKEEEYSNELRMEPNPTIYIGKFID